VGDNLLSCIQCVENVVGLGDHQVSDLMQLLVDLAMDPPDAGFCFYPDEYKFRQASTKLRTQYQFPLMLPMAMLPEAST
jgi:hypothetical protein